MDRLRRALALSAIGLLALGCQAPPVPVEPTFRVVAAADYETLFDATLSVLRVNEFTPRWADRQRGEIVTHPATSAQWFEFWRGDSPGGYAKLESSLHTTRRYVKLWIGDADANPPGAPVGGSGANPAGDSGANPVGGSGANPDGDSGTNPVGDSGTNFAGPAPGDKSSGIAAAADAPPAGLAAGGVRPNLAAAGASGPRDYTIMIEVQKERYSAPERQVTTASGALGIYNERLPTTDGLRRARTPGESWIPQGRDAELERWLLEKIVRMFEERRSERRPPARQPT